MIHAGGLSYRQPFDCYIFAMKGWCFCVLCRSKIRLHMICPVESCPESSLVVYYGFSSVQFTMERLYNKIILPGAVKIGIFCFHVTVQVIVFIICLSRFMTEKK